MWAAHLSPFSVRPDPTPVLHLIMIVIVICIVIISFQRYKRVKVLPALLRQQLNKLR